MVDIRARRSSGIVSINEFRCASRSGLGSDTFAMRNNLILETSRIAERASGRAERCAGFPILSYPAPGADDSPADLAKITLKPRPLSSCIDIKPFTTRLSGRYKLRVEPQNRTEELLALKVQTEIQH